MKKHKLYQVQIQAESLRARRHSPETLMFLRLPPPVDVVRALVAIRTEVEAVTAGADDSDCECDQDYLDRLAILEEVARRMMPFSGCNDSSSNQHISVAGTDIGQISYTVSEAWGD